MSRTGFKLSPTNTRAGISFIARRSFKRSKRLSSIKPRSHFSLHVHDYMEIDITRAGNILIYSQHCVQGLDQDAWRIFKRCACCAGITFSAKNAAIPMSNHAYITIMW
jgi:hypothetical protein